MTPASSAIVEVLPEVAWQRRYVHFLRNALDDLPRKAGEDCLKELRCSVSEPGSPRRPSLYQRVIRIFRKER
jgi:transposase-like protein